MPRRNKDTDNTTTTCPGPAPVTTQGEPASPSPPPDRASASASAGASTLSTSMASADFKAELLAALRQEMTGIFKAELQTAMTLNVSEIKAELLSIKTELTANLAAIRTDVSELRGTVAEMESSLSHCTDDVEKLKHTVERLSTQVLALENKCEDLEGRSRRNNVRIVGLSEQHAPVTTTSISRLLREVFNLDKDPVIDRAHRSMIPTPKHGERPRPVIARLHYYTDCADILQRARTRQRIRLQDSTISVFPDLTAKTAKARAAFNDVRRELRGIQDTRYGLIYPATLRITTSGGVTKNFTSPGEAAVFVKTLI
ncbi:unnamed protein product [Knipowitschia caucasica]